MSKQLVCECGSKSFTLSNNPMHNYVLSCNPPIHVSFYICDKCGKEHQIRKQEKSFEPQSQVVILDDNSYVVGK